MNQQAIDAIEGLTKIGIAVYNPDGTLRQLAEIIKDMAGITYRVPVSASAASVSLKDIIQKISDNRIREARGGGNMKDCNKMSWVKCSNCNFLMEITSCSGIEYMCNITSERLKMTNCIYCDEQGEGKDERV